MRSRSLPLLIAGCVLALLLACFGGVLFRGEQFGYRDAAHYYYPLYQRVQQEWDAGRWPLWEPEENAGMPLLGNPTAAVLYPGKVIYALFPYAWGARLYVVAHTVLAFAAMLAMMRSWGTSWTGSTLSALAYAFGVPILFQYCNIIFLVGAAWTPLGFRAVDRWLRLGLRRGLLELGVVLAMQTLGGDPESSYVTGVCAGGYAVGLTWRERKTARRPVRAWQAAVAAGLLGAGWATGVVVLSEVVPKFRPPHNTPLPLPWMPWVPQVVAGLWALAGLVLLARWVRRRRERLLLPRLAGLAGAAALAGLLAAAQLLPVVEFTRQSGRAAGGGPHDIYPFSLEPFRVVEMVWPNVFGNAFAANRSWLSLVTPAEQPARIWIPSLYLGGLAFVLALTAVGFRGGPPWRGWLSGVALLSLVASMGEYTGPNWWARFHPELEQRLGPHDPYNVAAIRLDGKLRDGDGGFYWTLATVLPGFRQFRFPSKLLSFTVLGVAGLAGIGWDRLPGGGRRRATVVSSVFLGLSVVGLPLALAFQDRIVAEFKRAIGKQTASPFGPFDAAGAVGELQRSLAQAVGVYVLALLVVRLSGRRPGLAGAVALVALTGDLAVANARYVITVPQTMLEGTPETARIIEEAERAAKDRTADPYRIHRMPIWNPLTWHVHASPARVKDFVQWERDTLQPKYGIPLGIQYTWTMGVAELYDYDWYFGGFLRTLNAEMARSINAKAGEKIVVFPRRAFDLWNSRYFILPGHPNGWADEFRGIAAFLGDAELIYPTSKTFQGPDAEQRQRAWLETQDYQIYRNRNCFPRAWVVHQGRPLKTIVGLERSDREGPMEEILFENNHFWYDPDRRVYDPRELAWVDQSEQRSLAPYLAGGPPAPTETVTIAHYGPQRVELDAVLERPGLVVLADVYYPGWRLTIDGREAPVYRANRLMRGAGVPAGKHRLVFTFEPRSFRVGGQVTLAGLATLAVLGLVCVYRPFSTSLARSS